ncbi:MAG: ABC transporter permease [Planctomycetota bacterium]
MRGLLAVARKEARHVLRDRATLRLALFIPLLQLTLFGSIDTNVGDVPTAVLDESRSEASRELVAELEATSVLRVTEYVDSREELVGDIVAARANVGIEIPPDYHRKRLAGEPAVFRVLVDGSDSTIASQSLAAVNGLALSKSLEELGALDPPIAARPEVLFNPAMKSANLLVPGLVGILLTFSATMLSAFAVVRERERGTLEQLLVTPVSPTALILGKLLPYLVLSLVQFVAVLGVMTTIFGVPIRGSAVLLAGLALLYLCALLALGLVISALSKSQVEAMQMAQMLLLPSILLSGYIFPLSSLPVALQWIGQILPATHFIAAIRGIVIRDAGLHDLWQHALALVVITVALLFAGVRAFKRVTG